MAPQGSSNHYPDYECYYYLNNRYVLNNKLYVSEDVEKFSSTYTIPPTKNNPLLEKILSNLKKYLSDGHSFYQYNPFYICSYISYLLYDQICKEDYSACDQDIFNILKKFADDYRIHSKSNICESKINYLNPSTYKKHKILYDLYDNYSIVIGKKQSDEDSLCNAFHMLIANYNVSIIKEESDENFINKLIELKKLIKNKVLHSNTKCGRDITHFKESNIEKRAKELEETRKRLQLEAEEKKRLQEAAEAEEKRQLQEAAQKQPQTEAEQAREGILSRQDDAITIEHQASYKQTEAHRIPQLAEGYTSTHLLMDQLDPQFYGPENTRVTLPSGEEGILEKMKSAISGIGEYVEPVPLMGVSGGMGAFFLLLRYTPVGTFFRGGRGRVRRIPSGFHGPFPGDFANFQEYDGGFIGYGPMNPLAE